MKISQFQHEWRGIQFRDLNIALPPGAPADKVFYDAFYKALAELSADQDSPWHLGKRALGEWIADHILRPLGRPKILSVGVGEALPELVWLRRGYDVTLNECQDNTLAAARAEFPDAPVLIGDAHSLKLTDTYQIATLLTVDYALSDQQLTEAFANLARSLSATGILVNYSVNILTWERLAKEVVKALMGRRRKPGSILWGWSRTPAAIAKLAKAAGLELKAQYAGRGRSFVARRRMLWPLPPLRNSLALMIFSKPPA